MDKRISTVYIDGLPFDSHFPLDHVEQALRFRPRDDDLIVSTYLKSGTTWIQYIVWSIQNKGQMPMPRRPDITNKIAPYLELAGTSVTEGLPSPRHLRVHLPYNKTPYNPKAKYIYVTRNPGDAFVSYFCFVRQREWYKNLDFNSVFDQFVSGVFPYGDYFDHFLSWYEHRNDSNVLFMTYESMLADHRGTVLKVAKFIGDENHNYVDQLTADNGLLLNCIVKNTTFNSMKENIDSTLSVKGQELKCEFFRKGTAGDRHNHLSEEQLRRLKERMATKWSSVDRASLGPHYN